MEDTKEYYIHEISVRSDRSGYPYLIDLMETNNVNNLMDISLDQAKSFYLKIADKPIIKWRNYNGTQR